MKMMKIISVMMIGVMGASINMNDIEAVSSIMQTSLDDIANKQYEIFNKTAKQSELVQSLDNLKWQLNHDLLQSEYVNKSAIAAKAAHIAKLELDIKDLSKLQQEIIDTMHNDIKAVLDKEAKIEQANILLLVNECISNKLMQTQTEYDIDIIYNEFIDQENSINNMYPSVIAYIFALTGLNEQAQRSEKRAKIAQLNTDRDKLVRQNEHYKTKESDLLQAINNELSDYVVDEEDQYRLK